MSDMTIEEYEKLNPIIGLEYKGTKIVYCIPNAHTLWRVHTLQSKEPDTLEWIAGFDKDDVLLDVGANVGMYTIWAAMTAGVSVYAFEPEAQNYALLNKNIFSNNLQDRVIAYAAALSDEAGFSDLHLSGFLIGGSCHSFGEAVDYHLQPRNTGLRQGCFSTTLDAIVESGVLPCPTHIKIDVDGIEHFILRGGVEGLKGVESVMVEIDDGFAEQAEETTRHLQNAGLKLLRKCGGDAGSQYNQWWVRGSA